MTQEWKIEVPELAGSLASDFEEGPIIDERGNRFLLEQQVAMLDGLKIEIFSDEHPPPHFRVLYSGETASFAIKDCRKLVGGLTKWERNIRRWHAAHKADLIAAWNRTRPTGCPVGFYRE